MDDAFSFDSLSTTHYDHSEQHSRPPLVAIHSAPANIASFAEAGAFLQPAHPDYRAMSFPPSSHATFVPEQHLTLPPQAAPGPSSSGSNSSKRARLDEGDSASEAPTTSASTVDGLFPRRSTPGLDFGADDYTEDADEAGPMEFGESVLSFGAKAGGGLDALDSVVEAGPSTSAAAKRKKARTVSAASQQRLLSEVPVDEDGKATGRRKIQIEYIQDRSRRHITFSKRKAGIMKKAYELSTLTGTQVLLLVVSEVGTVYTYTTEKLEPLVKETEGKELIRDCLDADAEEGASLSPPESGPSKATSGSKPTTRRSASNPNLRKQTSNPNLRKRTSSSALATTAASQEQVVPPVPALPQQYTNSGMPGQVRLPMQDPLPHEMDYSSAAATSGLYAIPRYGGYPQYPQANMSYYPQQQMQHMPNLMGYGQQVDYSSR